MKGRWFVCRSIWGSEINSNSEINLDIQLYSYWFIHKGWVFNNNIKLFGWIFGFYLGIYPVNDLLKFSVFRNQEYKKRLYCSTIVHRTRYTMFSAVHCLLYTVVHCIFHYIINCTLHSAVQCTLYSKIYWILTQFRTVTWERLTSNSVLSTIV